MARREPGEILYEDDDVMVFRNHLRWVPIMLLVIPKEHYTQSQLWQDSMVAKVGRVAAEVGAEQCPGGFRLLSNFGRAAMQSQSHGHVHILGGTQMGPYV